LPSQKEVEANYFILLQTLLFILSQNAPRQQAKYYNPQGHVKVNMKNQARGSQVDIYHLKQAKNWKEGIKKA